MSLLRSSLTLLPWLCLGLSTAAVLLWLPVFPAGLGRVDLLLAAAGMAGLWTAVGWLAVLGVTRSTGWAIAWGACLFVPYLNLVLASIYARRYWADGARAPALLGLAAFGVQTLLLLRLLDSTPTTLV